MQETHLKQSHKASLPTFQQPERFDRLNQQGGGVAIFVKQGLPFTKIDLLTNLEAAALKLHYPNRTITICSLYIPPNYSNTHLHTELNSLIKQLPEPLIICTDANAHHEIWGSPISDGRGNTIFNFIEDLNLALLNTGEPTYITHNGNHTHIDLSICSSSLASKLDWQPHFDNFNSDHFPILLGIDLPIPYHPPIPRWNTKAADWNKFNAVLKIPTDYITPTQSCGAVTTAIINAANQSVPKQTETVHRNCYYWNSDCTRAKRQKNQALNRYNNHKGDITLWIKYKKARAVFRHTINQAIKNSWTEFLSNFNSKTSSSQVWNKVKKLNKKQKHKSIVLKISNDIISNPPSVAEELAKHFSKFSNGQYNDVAFNSHRITEEKNVITFEHSSNEWFNSDFSMDELHIALSSCNSTSPGPDSIPYEFIKISNCKQKHHLLNFFNFLYNSGFPHQWRETTIIPILKPNKLSTSPISYRPIALTNCLCKVMEKMVNRRLQQHLETLEHFNPNQSGFRASHSTNDPLCRLEFSARNALLKKEFCVAIFLDIEKAFDTVWHHGLLHKIKTIGINGSLAKFIQNFLIMRKINVRVASSLSNSFPIHSGVPQGSVLSPTLFLLFINDLLDGVPADVETSLYADDAALWVNANTIEECHNKLQRALNSITNWSQKWGLAICGKKRCAVIFTLRHYKSPPLFKLGETTIPYTKTAKFLGLHFDSRLTWKEHIVQIRNRCIKDLQLLTIIAHNRWGADYHTLYRLYSSLILPKIDYGSIFYDTASKTNLLILDRIQYAASRTILGALRCTPTIKLEAEADLMPLSIRRRMLLTMYGSRVSSVPNHPVRNLIVNYLPIQEILKHKYTLSAIGRLYDELKLLSISPNKIPLIPLNSKYNTKTLPVQSTLAVTPKYSTPPNIWQGIFRDHITTKHQNRVHIYTDGSKQLSNTGCGVWSKNFTLMNRLPPDCTIFTAELFSIYSALKFIEKQPGKFSIFSDSLSSILALQSLQSSSHYLIHWITELLLSFPSDKVVVDWVPSHMGIPGNENADAVACSSLSLHTILSYQFSMSELRPRIKRPG